MKRISLILLVLIVSVVGAQASDWSNPNPRAGGDMAGPLLLKHEDNMTDLYTSTTGKLNLLKGNFSGIAAPTGPNTGQGWYDSTNKVFKLYDSTWGGGGYYSAVASSFPGGLSSGTVSGGTTTIVGPLVISSPVSTLSGTVNFTGTTNVTGTAAFTGNTTFNRVGASPFSTSSTTKVDNLNADLLDGYSASTTTAVNVVPVTGADGKIPPAFFNGTVPNATWNYITSSGTWTVPNNVSLVWVFMSGGGGSGGGGCDMGAGNSAGGGGGGAGNKIRWYPLSVTPGTSWSVTIGTGAPDPGACLDGTAGNTTIVTRGTTTISAGGGGGGARGSGTRLGGNRGVMVAPYTTPTYRAGTSPQPDWGAFWYSEVLVNTASGATGATGAGSTGGGNGGGPLGGYGGLASSGSNAPANSGDGGGGGGGESGLNHTAGAGGSGYVYFVYFAL